MAGWDALKGLVVVPHGTPLEGIRHALGSAGIVVADRATSGETVHLVPYDQSVAIITDPDEPPIAWLATPINATWLLTAIRTAVELLRAERAVNESRALLQICRAMGSERDVPTLHRLIVRKARELTNADAGTLYLLDDDEKTLRFAVSQTGPHDEERFAGSTVEVSADSIAGHVAMTGESIRIGDAYADLPPSRVRFDASFDKSTEYRTKSVLCVPIRNVSDQIVGVLQLINRKPNFDAVLGHGVVLEEVVMPFDEHDEEIVIALASQAGAVLERH